MNRRRDIIDVQPAPPNTPCSGQLPTQAQTCPAGTLAHCVVSSKHGKWFACRRCLDHAVRTTLAVPFDPSHGYDNRELA